jgi:hypothetical protein
VQQWLGIIIGFGQALERPHLRHYKPRA